MRRLAAVLSTTTIAIVAPPAAAESVADFYRGKTLNIGDDGVEAAQEASAASS